jgi:hypothetical protein
MLRGVFSAQRALAGLAHAELRESLDEGRARVRSIVKAAHLGGFESEARGERFRVDGTAPEHARLRPAADASVGVEHHPESVVPERPQPPSTIGAKPEGRSMTKASAAWPKPTAAPMSRRMREPPMPCGLYGIGAQRGNRAGVSIHGGSRLRNCSTVAVAPCTAAIFRTGRFNSRSFFAKETVAGCGGPKGASLAGTKNMSPWNTTFSAGSQAMTICLACGFGPMSISSSRRLPSSIVRRPFSSSRNSGLRGSRPEAVVLFRGCHRLDDGPVLGRGDDGRTLGDEAAHPADVVAVVVRHRDVADRLSRNQLVDSLDQRVRAVARARRLDGSDEVGELHGHRVLVLARDVLDHVDAVGQLFHILLERGRDPA